MKRVLLAMMLLLPIGVWAQDKKEESKPALASKMFEVKPGNVDRINEALRSLLGGDAARTDRSAGMIVVRTQPELMPAVEQVVRRLDTAVPIPNNVEITVYLLEASREPVPAAVSIPPDLQPTVTQLRNIFAYQNFQLLDTVVLRSRSDQRATASGILSFAKGQPVPYQLMLRPTVQADERTRSIRIDDLRFSTRVPVTTATAQSFSNEASINANIDVKDSQKVVVGKTGLEGTQRALILVLSGKVVD